MCSSDLIKKLLKNQFLELLTNIENSNNINGTRGYLSELNRLTTVTVRNSSFLPSVSIIEQSIMKIAYYQENALVNSP